MSFGQVRNCTYNDVPNLTAAAPFLLRELNADFPCEPMWKTGPFWPALTHYFQVKTTLFAILCNALCSAT